VQCCGASVHIYNILCWIDFSPRDQANNRHERALLDGQAHFDFLYFFFLTLLFYDLTEYARASRNTLLIYCAQLVFIVFLRRGRGILV
jgi:hypothetical protein